MLILSRKPKEEILIGNGIKVTVLQVRGQAVRIGIEAPGDVSILRAELQKKTDVAPATASEAAGTSAEVPTSEEAAPERLPIRPLPSTRESEERLPHRPLRGRMGGSSTLHMLAARRREAALARALVDLQEAESDQ